MNIRSWAAWSHFWALWFGIYTAFSWCFFMSRCQGRQCQCGKDVLPQSNSHTWLCNSYLTVGVLAGEHHTFLSLGNFPKWLSWCFSRSYMVQKGESGRDLILRLKALEPWKGRLSSVIIIDVVYHYKVKECLEFAHYAKPRKENTTLSAYQTKARKKWLFICQNTNYPLDLSSEPSSAYTTNIDSGNSEHSRILDQRTLCTMRPCCGNEGCIQVKSKCDSKFTNNKTFPFFSGQGDIGGSAVGVGLSQAAFSSLMKVPWTGTSSRLLPDSTDWRMESFIYCPTDTLSPWQSRRQKCS